MIEFCGCKNRCAEEDACYRRPNGRGICEAYCEDPTPSSLAHEIFLKMSPEERSTAIRQGAANVEDRVKERVPDWSYSAVETCLDEIGRLCTDAAEE